jgi:3D (Asp-Asp-Asp) domain-containing protein/peptidoglycan hydrolase CwlO-like protein
VIFAACFCLLTLAPTGTAGHAPLGQLRADDANLAAKSRSAVLDLYSLDTELTGAEARLATLQGDVRTLRTERRSIDYQIRVAHLDARISQQRLAARLRFIYEHGTTSSLDVLMGAKSIEDAMTQLDDFNRVAAANADVLTQARLAQWHLSHLGRELSLREHALAATTLAAGDTVDELNAEHAERAAYIEQLATQRSLDSAQIARLDARAQAAAALSQQLTVASPAATATPAPAPVLSAQVGDAPAQVGAAPMQIGPTPLQLGSVPLTGARTLTVTATGYDLDGTTSTGLPVGWGIVAVDPAVIPLGTHLNIPGYGEAVAADTGSAIVGSTIDLWFPTAAQAIAWGRRTITIDVD